MSFTFRGLQMCRLGWKSGSLKSQQDSTRRRLRTPQMILARIREENETPTETKQSSRSVGGCRSATRRDQSKTANEAGVPVTDRKTPAHGPAKIEAQPKPVSGTPTHEAAPFFLRARKATDLERSARTKVQAFGAWLSPADEPVAETARGYQTCARAEGLDGVETLKHATQAVDTSAHESPGQLAFARA